MTCVWLYLYVENILENMNISNIFVTVTLNKWLGISQKTFESMLSYGIKNSKSQFPKFHNSLVIQRMLCWLNDKPH